MLINLPLVVLHTHTQSTHLCSSLELGPSRNASRASAQQGTSRGSQSQAFEVLAPLCPWEASV